MWLCCFQLSTFIYYLNNKFSRWVITCPTRGQSYKTIYTLGQSHKLVLNLDNMLLLRKYLVIILGHYTLKYSPCNFFDRGTISNLGTLFYTSQRLKLLYKIGPWTISFCKKSGFVLHIDVAKRFDRILNSFHFYRVCLMWPARLWPTWSKVRPLRTSVRRSTSRMISPQAKKSKSERRTNGAKKNKTKKCKNII